MSRIGTAGWSIPSRFAAEFPGTGSHLERYAQRFSTAEINSSFHRPHRRTTYARWAASVPPDFRFSVKLPKAISHTARLVDVERPLEEFVAQIEGLGDRLGVVLLQLPPSFAYDPAVVPTFLATLRTRLDHAVGIACEPRHASWFTSDADACLVAQRVARVVADPVLVRGGERPGGWRGLRYHRLHGAPRIYYSAYDEPWLMALAEQRGEEEEDGWYIFDNTASGAAAGDALALKRLLGG